MANNRRELATEFTNLVLTSITAEEASPMRPRNPVLVTTSFRSPVAFKRRLKRAAKLKGVEQTQLLIHAMGPILAVILGDQEPGEFLDLFEKEAVGNE